MISTAHIATFARYNAWQNRSLYSAGDTLDDAARKLNRGAFFRSIHETLSHLFWADQLWMHRFTGSPKPAAGSIAESAAMAPEWDALKRGRFAYDEVLIDWSTRVEPDWLAGETRWFSGAMGREVAKPNWLLVAHMFNHQTHHRGQVHAMLTAAGARPADTDLPFMPEDA